MYQFTRPGPDVAIYSSIPRVPSHYTHLTVSSEYILHGCDPRLLDDEIRTVVADDNMDRPNGANEQESSSSSSAICPILNRM